MLDPKLLIPLTSGNILPLSVILVTVMLGSPVNPVQSPANDAAVSVFVPGLYFRSVSVLTVSPLPPAVSTKVIKLLKI